MSSKLETVEDISYVIKNVVENVESIVHIEDFFALAKGNSFLAMNFYELLCNINYCIFSPAPVRPIGQIHTGTIGTAEAALGIPSPEFPCTLKGKLEAVSYCFALQANKMDGMISSEILTQFMQGTGAAQIAQDTAKALLNGGMDILKQGVSTLPLAAAGV